MAVVPSGWRRDPAGTRRSRAQDVPLDGPRRLSYQAALLAMSVWVLGSLLLGASYATVGTGGIVVLIGTLVVVRVIVGLLHR